MTEFYSWSLAARMAVTFFIALCILSQTMSAILGFFRRRSTPLRIFENTLEVAILIQILVCSLLHGQVVQAVAVWLIPETGYAGLRIVVFVIITVLTITAFAFRNMGAAGRGQEAVKNAECRIKNAELREVEHQGTGVREQGTGGRAQGVGSRRRWCARFFELSLPWFLLLPVVLAAGLTLPFFEAIAGNSFAYIYLAAMVYWFVRSICSALSHSREIRSDLSTVSIKNAVDSLSTGVMFCEKNGFVLLVNSKMQDLMVALTGKMQRNGRQFYEQLTSGKAMQMGSLTQAPGEDYKTAGLKDRSVCLMPDGSAWNISAAELKAGRKDYFQLIASDITERWRLMEELQSKNSELLRRQNELGELITNIHNLTHEREIQKAKMRTHDILSQRLTLLLRNIRNEQALDFALLRSLAHGLMDDLKSVSRPLPPKEELDALIATFRSVGVSVTIDGQLPVDSESGRILTEIIREAVTNSVRHGFATQVQVQIDDSEEACHLQINDNGYPPSGQIIEGGGIGGIREKVKSFGGTVTVSHQPRFMLTVELKRSVEHEC